MYFNDGIFRYIVVGPIGEDLIENRNIKIELTFLQESLLSEPTNKRRKAVKAVPDVVILD